MVLEQAAFIHAGGAVGMTFSKVVGMTDGMLTVVALSMWVSAVINIAM